MRHPLYPGQSIRLVRRHGPGHPAGGRIYAQQARYAICAHDGTETLICAAPWVWECVAVCPELFPGASRSGLSGAKCLAPMDEGPVEVSPADILRVTARRSGGGHCSSPEVYEALVATVPTDATLLWHEWRAEDATLAWAPMGAIRPAMVADRWSPTLAARGFDRDDSAALRGHRPTCPRIASEGSCGEEGCWCCAQMFRYQVLRDRAATAPLTPETTRAWVAEGPAGARWCLCLFPTMPDADRAVVQVALAAIDGSGNDGSDQ